MEWALRMRRRPSVADALNKTPPEAYLPVVDNRPLSLSLSKFVSRAPKPKAFNQKCSNLPHETASLDLLPGPLACLTHLILHTSYSWHKNHTLCRLPTPRRLTSAKRPSMTRIPRLHSNSRSGLPRHRPQDLPRGKLQHRSHSKRTRRPR
jgi:hypothetical protein